MIVKQWWPVALKVLVSVALLVWLAHSVPLGDALNLLPNARPGWVLLAVLLLGLSQFVSGWRWWLVAGGGLSFFGCVKYTWVSTFWSMVLPGALSADVAKGLAMKSGGESSSGSRLAASIFLDRVAGLGMLLVVGLVFLKWSGLAKGILDTWAGPVAGLGLLVMVLLPRLRHISVPFVSWLQALALSLLVNALNVSFYWACALSVGGTDTWPYMGAYTLLLNLAMLLPVSIGGVGIREQLSIHLLSNSSGAAGSVAFSWMVLLVTLLHGLAGLALQMMKRLPGPGAFAPSYLPFQRKT